MEFETAQLGRRVDSEWVELGKESLRGAIEMGENRNASVPWDFDGVYRETDDADCRG